MTTRFIGVRELRQQLAKIGKRAQEKNERFIVLRKNQFLFEIRPLSQKAMTLEKLLSDIKEAKDDVKANRVYTTKEVQKMLNL